MALTNEIEWKLALSDENRILIVTKSFRLVIFFAYSRAFFVIFFAFHRNAPPPFSFHSLATNLPEIEIVVSSLKKKKRERKIDSGHQSSACTSISIRDIRMWQRVVVANRYPKRTRDILHRVLHRVVKQNSIFLPRLDVIRGN